MKSLAYIANIRLPTEKAHGIQIMKTCEAFCKIGINIELFIPKRKNYIKDDIFRFYNISKNFQIKKVFCFDFIFFPIFKKLWFYLETFTFYIFLKKYIKNKKIDFYYTRDLYIALKLSKKNKNVFYEIHTLPKIIKNKHKKAWKKVRGLIVISDGIKKELIKNGVKEEKIIIARDAVDLKKFVVLEKKEDSRKKLGLLLKKNIVVYTGHLYDWKGVSVLAKASEKLKDIEIYLVGGTKKDVLKFKNKYNFSNLHIVGWQKHELIPVWLNSADVLVLPNSQKYKISSDYTSPMKLFEYMSSKKPIVASDISSLREVLNKENSVLIDSDNVGALVVAIKNIFKNKESYKKISDQAFKDVQEYSWEKRAEKIADFLLQNNNYYYKITK